MKNLLLKCGATLFVGLLAMAGCTAKTPKAAENPTAVAPAVETRIVEVTREVEKTVVVTATPIPTPTYASVINAAPGTLVYPITGEPASLDPQIAQDEVSELVAAQLYEGLFDLRGDGSTAPAAATAFTASADSKTYTVTLRAGMTWSDGQPVMARDYVNGVCRLLDPTVGSPYYYLLTDIAPVQGARDYASGDAADCKKIGVQAVDDLTLRIVLAQPAAHLPQLLALPVFWPAAPPPAQAITGTAPLSTTLPAAPVVNGAYLVAEKVPGKSLTLVKNPTYWNAAAVAVERIEFRVAPDAAKQLALYEAGDLQVADFPAGETARIEADPAFKQELHVLVQPGASYLGLNTQSGPTADVNVRRAVASAIDRKKLIEEVLKQPWHLPAQTLIPPGVPGHQETPELGIPYDPAAARESLTEAGFGPGKPIPPVELWFNREGNNEALFKAVGAMLEEVGIPVRLVSAPWAVYRDSLDACNKPNRAGATKSPAACSYNLYRMGWVLDYPDPSSLLDVVFGPKSAFQYTGWQSKEYEDLLASARAERDETRRLALYQQAEGILLNDLVVVVPLQFYDRTVLVKAAVEFDFPQFGAPHLKYWKTP